MTFVSTGATVRFCPMPIAARHKRMAKISGNNIRILVRRSLSVVTASDLSIADVQFGDDR